MNVLIDWMALRVAALAAAGRAYAPYSGYAVGCAALVDDGRIISGCNVENASYGVTLCAECTMIGQLYLDRPEQTGSAAGSHEPSRSEPSSSESSSSESSSSESSTAAPDPARPRLIAFDCVNGEGDTIAPCGRCRQLLAEHSVPGMVLNAPSGPRTIEEMLPEVFGSDSLR